MTRRNVVMICLALVLAGLTVVLARSWVVSQVFQMSGELAAPPESQASSPSPSQVAGQPIDRLVESNSDSVPEPDIDVVARAFLHRGDVVGEDFAFIGYLLFPNALSNNYDQRRAAAAAFLCLFEDASAVQDLGALPERMAVFYAPIKDTSNDAELLRRRSVDLFLDVYDYFSAENLARTFGLDLSGVYLVGYIPAPGRTDDPQARDVLTLDFTGQPPKRIEAALLSLDEKFSVAAWYHALNGGGVLDIARQVFGSLGQMLGVPAAQAGPSDCR